MDIPDLSAQESLHDQRCVQVDSSRATLAGSWVCGTHRISVVLYPYEVGLVADSENASTRRQGPATLGAEPTDGLLFREISDSTIFEAISPIDSDRWVKALAELIDEMLATRSRPRTASGLVTSPDCRSIAARVSLGGYWNPESRPS
jgi:hypothetical protein